MGWGVGLKKLKEDDFQLAENMIMERDKSDMFVKHLSLLLQNQSIMGKKSFHLDWSLNINKHLRILQY